jgi:demethylspheroidene O-methyltransferase
MLPAQGIGPARGLTPIDGGSPAGWLDRVRLAAAGVVADPRFRAWAAAFPLTRGIARRRARALFDLCGGFVYSQILRACVELDLFKRLRDGPKTAVALAPALGLELGAARRLLDAAVALDLLARHGKDAYRLGMLGAAMVDNPGIAAMVRHHAMLYADLSDPVALLRGERHDTALGAYWPYAGTDRPEQLGDDRIAAYTALMAQSQAMVAAEILAAYPLARHRCLLDLGGGDGTFLGAVAAAAPRLALMLFDLPAVAERARARLGDRATIAGGNFLVDPLPLGADIVTLVRVLHDHDDDRALAILRAARRALPPGGTVLVAEPMAGTPDAEGVGDAYFGFYLLAMGSGQPRSASRIEEMMLASGFARIRAVKTRTPLIASVLTGRVP